MPPGAREAPATHLCCTLVVVLGTGHRQALELLPPGSSPEDGSSVHLACAHTLWGPQSLKNWSPQLVCRGTQGESPPVAKSGEEGASLWLRGHIIFCGLAGPCRTLSLYSQTPRVPHTPVSPASGTLPVRATDHLRHSSEMEAGGQLFPPGLQQSTGLLTLLSPLSQTGSTATQSGLGHLVPWRHTYQ